MENRGSVFGGALLVAGTSIGGGMLALPVITALGGFLPTIVVNLLCWLFMCSTGLIFVELCLSLEGEPNIISMAKSTLGSAGKIIAWVVYLFLFYCLTVAYVAGGGELVTEVFDGLPGYAGVLIFTLVFGVFVYLGARAVDKVNVVLMAGLIISYLIFVFMGMSSVNFERLLYKDWFYSLIGVSVIFTSFGFQGLVPSLCTYMRRRVKVIRMAIIIGSAIPFVIYALWEWLILGIIPVYGKGGLVDAMLHGYTVVAPLKNVIGNRVVVVTSQFFAFFALVSSFLGVTLGLSDFLADGFKIKKTARGRFWICLMVFVPAMILAISGPGVFLSALKYAGAYGVAVLLGLLPVAMVWSARYYKKMPSGYRFFGGKKVLVLLAVLGLAVIAIEIVEDFGSIIAIDPVVCGIE